MNPANLTAHARSALEQCQHGQPVSGRYIDPILDIAFTGEPAAAEQATRILFRDLIEPLCDPFEPALVRSYVELFARIIERGLPGLSAASLVARYDRIREPRPFNGASPSSVFVLSRVTLGADVAVTSVALDAAKRRFPAARIHLVGSSKAFELFSADSRIAHLPAPYSRGGALRDRLQVALDLRMLLDQPGSLVIDPDSRLTQLGLVPVCPDDRYLFFESRSAWPESAEPLPALTARWLHRTLDVVDARAFVSPAAPPLVAGQDAVTVSLGTGENPAKGTDGDFEARVLRALGVSGRLIVIDQGMGGEEQERVQRAIAASGVDASRFRTHLGAFAPFAAAIARSRLYFGYDSSGQHVAAASGTPLVTLFRGFAAERTFQRWRPHGPGRITVVRGDRGSLSELAEATESAIARMLA